MKFILNLLSDNPFIFILDSYLKGNLKKELDSHDTTDKPFLGLEYNAKEEIYSVSGIKS